MSTFDLDDSATFRIDVWYPLSEVDVEWTSARRGKQTKRLLLPPPIA